MTKPQTGMKKAADVLIKLGVKDWGMDWDTKSQKPVEINPLAEAQVALCSDLLAALPEKQYRNDKLDDVELQARVAVWNSCIELMEETIRSYFEQTKGKGE